jgi:hypothetical protein
MLEGLQHLLVSIGDAALGGLLRLPRDAVLILLALLTGLVLTVVRRWTTDQDLLRRCKEDKRRLKQLLKEARRRKDREAVKRIRATIGQIGMMAMKAEGKPLLVSLPIIVVLAVWAFARIAYLPPKPGEPLEVRFYFPESEIGRTVFLLPEPGLTAGGGWLRKIQPSYAADGVTVDGGVAAWKLRVEPRSAPYRIRLRHRGQVFERPLIADGVRYANPLVVYHGEEEILASELGLREYRPFGVVPGWPALALQPWVVGYLIIVLPLSVGLKPLLRIY